jgi:Glycosyl transferase family 2
MDDYEPSPLSEGDLVETVLRPGEVSTDRVWPTEMSAGNDDLGVSVVVCAYTEQRWEQIRAAVESALSQHPQPAEVLLIVDHNADLAARARRELGGVTVLESDGTPGLSGARNAGLRAANQPVTVFLDDDAEARPGWLASLVEPYLSPNIVATGGSVHPRWPGLRPNWLPAEFDWVVGCSYRGLPESAGPVRNPIGANMSMRTGLALEVGGFDGSIGRIGSHPRGCEETELAIRLTASRPGSIVFYVPAAAVDHHVGQERLKPRYFLGRCWHEGQSKATVARLTGASAGLERERRHVAVVIPAALLRDLRGSLGGDAGACLRIAAILAGLTAATAGYVVGRAQLAGQRRTRTLAELQQSPTGRSSGGLADGVRFGVRGENDADAIGQSATAMTGPFHMRSPDDRS